MTYKCTACGKQFERGAVIIPPHVYCPSCAEKLNDIIDDFVVRYLEARLSGKQIPDLNRYIEERREEIKFLKIRESLLKRRILTACLRSEQPVRG